MKVVGYTTSLTVLLIFLAACQPSYGPLPNPKGAATIDPWSLPQERSESETRYRFPSGWHLVLEDGFEMVPTLPDHSAFLYRDSFCIMVLDGGSSRPRVLYRPRRKNSVGAVPTWSPDGRYCFQFFDCNLQLVAVEVSTSKMVSLTDYPVHRNYKGAAHFEPIIRGPFVYDSEGEQLVYVEQDYGEPHDAQLVAVSFPVGKRRVISGNVNLHGYLTHWAASLAEGRFYTVAKYDRHVDIWNFNGTHLGTIEPPIDFPRVSYLFSPDGSLSGLNAVVSNSTGKPTSLYLPGEHSHQLSYDSRRIAFLCDAEEAWVYDVESDKAQRLARIVPRADAPDWSRDGYYVEPIWSKNGRMLAVGLSSFAGRKSYIDRVTLLFDLEAKRVVALPCRTYARSWCPVPKPFPRPFYVEPTKPTLGEERGP